MGLGLVCRFIQAMFEVNRVGPVSVSSLLSRLHGRMTWECSHILVDGFAV